MTILLTICADDTAMPLYIIVKGGGRVPGWWAGLQALLRGTSFEAATISSHSNAWMTAASFEEWFVRWFVPYKETKLADRPALFVMDNFIGHITLPVMEAAVAANIHVIGLPPHSTHMLQPLDRRIMHPLKHWFFKSLSIWRLQGDNMTKVVTMATAITLLARPVSYASLTQQQCARQPTLLGELWRQLEGKAPTSRGGRPSSLLPMRLPLHGTTLSAPATSGPHSL
jgi:hypothetical protein